VTGGVHCEVVARDPIRSRHPLATRTGFHALASMIAAGQHWRPLTARGKTALRDAYRAALAAAQVGDRIPLPTLPDGTHRATVHALTRRGLVADGRLTPLAVEVCAWALLGEERPVRDTPATGGQL